MNARHLTEYDPRVAGDPTYVRALWRGEIAMPALVTAQARWEIRQAALIDDSASRARMLLPILDRLIAEFGTRLALAPLTDLRDGLASVAAEGDGHE